MGCPWRGTRCSGRFVNTCPAQAALMSFLWFEFPSFAQGSRNPPSRAGPLLTCSAGTPPSAPIRPTCWGGQLTLAVGCMEPALTVGSVEPILVTGSMEPTPGAARGVQAPPILPCFSPAPPLPAVSSRGGGDQVPSCLSPIICPTESRSSYIWGSGHLLHCFRGLPGGVSAQCGAGWGPL